MSSADHLDRLWDARMTANLLSQQRLTVPHGGAKLAAAYVGQSKSSLDLHLTAHFMDRRECSKLCCRSRSSSSSMLERTDAV